LDLEHLDTANKGAAPDGQRTFVRRPPVSF